MAVFKKTDEGATMELSLGPDPTSPSPVITALESPIPATVDTGDAYVGTVVHVPGYGFVAVGSEGCHRWDFGFR